HCLLQLKGLDGSQGPTPELLASLQSLGENSDYTLLPHSLHQIAEAYSLNEDYQWAIQFLQLEKLYHERLLSNLTVLQENWADGSREKHFETLSQICRTHLSTISDLELSSIQTGCEEEDGDTCEEGQEVEEEEEEPFLIQLCSIQVDDEICMPQKICQKYYDTMKMHIAFFHFLLPDEVGGDSCLILLLLCLVTVVISIGGTALYCTLLDTYSNICIDFTHNVDFYVMNLRRLLEGLGRWLPFRT
uniref:Consortin, connexin sorting protein b n=1 Tax=Amphilophus citrinellus TaxID=61819 RepID=A0A3Q0RYH2_AMPCI